jgi:hypothetical protein
MMRLIAGFSTAQPSTVRLELGSFMIKRLLPLYLLIFTATLSAQVYSPKLLREGQPDSSNLKKFVQVIYEHADARTPREKAEAIWRFFLTDGRFVKPGYIYHIAGWAYEEPSGEVLDPIKLLNSYGFGLCYHIAPLLQSVFDAGGFEDARTWFLTGHTVTEVFYDGKYHYFDSDMMGYNVIGEGAFRGERVASVRDLEQNPNIILAKLQAADKVKPGTVDSPWYPADVRAKAMTGLAGLFSSTKDNYLYSGKRYTAGHSMDFVLRPGETLIRYFAPEEPGLFYLPYKFDGQRWTEFPQEVSQYQIRTEDGPHSQKDDRSWATGRIEYNPPAPVDQNVTVIRMPSPYVIVDARFSMTAELRSVSASLRFETSTDGGTTWKTAGELKGLHQGEWSTEPAVIAKSEHGRLTAVSGSYGYEIKITKTGGSATRLRGLHLVSRFQLNPRTLPYLQTGENQLVYSSAAPTRRIEIPAPLEHAPVHDLQFINEAGQGLLRPLPGKNGEAIYALEADGDQLTGFEAGARFLDLRNGLAPNKLTAETRHTTVVTQKGTAALSWSTNPNGPFHELWRFPEDRKLRVGDPIERLLPWPEAFRQVHSLPQGTKRVYVKFMSAGPAFDQIRLAVYAAAVPPDGSLKITQVWRTGGTRREHVELIDAKSAEHRFKIAAGSSVQNEAVIMTAVHE